MIQMVYLQQIPWNKPCELGNQCHHDMACGHIPTHLPRGNAPQSQVEFHQCLHLEIFYPHMLVVPHSINLKCSALERIYQTRFWDFELSKLWNQTGFNTTISWLVTSNSQLIPYLLAEKFMRKSTSKQVWLYVYFVWLLVAIKTTLRPY